ncbi:ADP-dependent (S)-NAD(P)H-hydrate dehydratase [Enterococcus florum]|uniref:ADP-dependent (S)-NAD(P)H-hydrate dehydratase n=1 Tax=Enterococcus florum TaxID=2480627 RepID=A0A4P5PCR3_9ENTE|nr:NAD(P)H-hydrate dehydratase [Enterococcus florum]GCF93768.1 ADP-dependent (S)-NAD(P)H-hydrate dehydratase [Enterococcus florum]
MIELTDDILAKVIKKRPEESHKGTFGRAVLIGGNYQYGGAIIMSAEACIHSGAGLTTVVTTEKNHHPLHARLPEAMVLNFSDWELLYEVVRAADVVLIGPGLGLDATVLAVLKGVLAEQQKDQWLVIDGSAITLVAKHQLSLKYPKQVIFTPHQMEWKRLSGLTIEEQTTENNQAMQEKLGATIILKKHRTEIYNGQTVYKNTVGNAGMATGGTGDTLAGMIAGFAAQFENTSDAVAAAVYLHSKIGDDLAEENYVVLPTKVSQALPGYMKKYNRKGS